MNTRLLEEHLIAYISYWAGESRHNYYEMISHLISEKPYFLSRQHKGQP